MRPLSVTLGAVFAGLQFTLFISPINKHTSLGHPERLHILPTMLGGVVGWGFPWERGQEHYADSIILCLLSVELLTQPLISVLCPFFSARSLM